MKFGVRVAGSASVVAYARCLVDPLKSVQGPDVKYSRKRNFILNVIGKICIEGAATHGETL